MHCRVALSNIYLLKKMGAEVTVAGPPTLNSKYIKEAFGVNVIVQSERSIGVVRCCQRVAHTAGKTEPAVCFLLCANTTLLTE